MFVCETESEKKMLQFYFAFKIVIDGDVIHFSLTIAKCTVFVIKSMLRFK